MIPLSKILLPVDFSERCLGAARYAASLASRFQAEIALLHVVEPLRYDFGEMEFAGGVANEVLQSRVALARQQLDAFLGPELAGARVSRTLLEGDPARRIVEYAHDRQVGLIAMPTHGYGPFRRFILGSVTAKVLHDADCPVLTGVHLEGTPELPSTAFHTILCAVDLGPQSRKTLCWAAQMAAEFGARLLLAHAIPSIEARPGDYFDTGLAEQLSKAAREELAHLQQEMRAEAETVVEGGDPPQVVSRLAAERKADLLVIGRGSAAGLFGRLRTNAYAIIRQSPCPVVSV
ncbi:MAG: universal stress protein [Bryobacteraceae bacterium]|jgi:nucleotide-binding universal stress UspA family protein